MAEPRLDVYSIRQSTVDPDGGGVNERSGDRRVVITTFIGDRNIFSLLSRTPKLIPMFRFFVLSYDAWSFIFLCFIFRTIKALQFRVTLFTVIDSKCSSLFSFCCRDFFSAPLQALFLAAFANHVTQIFAVTIADFYCKVQWYLSFFLEIQSSE